MLVVLCFASDLALESLVGVVHDRRSMSPVDVVRVFYPLVNFDFRKVTCVLGTLIASCLMGMEGILNTPLDPGARLKCRIDIVVDLHESRRMHESH